MIKLDIDPEVLEIHWLSRCISYIFPIEHGDLFSNRHLSFEGGILKDFFFGGFRWFRRIPIR